METDLTEVRRFLIRDIFPDHTKSILPYCPLHPKEACHHYILTFAHTLWCDDLSAMHINTRSLLMQLRAGKNGREHLSQLEDCYTKLLYDRKLREKKELERKVIEEQTLKEKKEMERKRREEQTIKWRNYLDREVLEEQKLKEKKEVERKRREEQKLKDAKDVDFFRKFLNNTQIQNGKKNEIRKPTHVSASSLRKNIEPLPKNSSEHTTNSKSFLPRRASFESASSSKSDDFPLYRALFGCSPEKPKKVKSPEASTSKQKFDVVTSSDSESSFSECFSRIFKESCESKGSLSPCRLVFSTEEDGNETSASQIKEAQIPLAKHSRIPGYFQETLECSLSPILAQGNENGLTTSLIETQSSLAKLSMSESKVSKESALKAEYMFDPFLKQNNTYGIFRRNYRNSVVQEKQQRVLVSTP